MKTHNITKTSRGLLLRDERDDITLVIDDALLTRLQKVACGELRYTTFFDDIGARWFASNQPGNRILFKNLRRMVLVDGIELSANQQEK